MFQAQKIVKIGNKFRIAFPSEYRERLTEGVIITYWFEKALFVTSEKNWKHIRKRELENKSILSSKVRQLRRFLIGGVSSIEFDAQGRFVMPEYLRKYAQLYENEEVVFVWQDDYVEIWNKRHWEEDESRGVKNIAAIADEFVQVEK